MSAMTRSLLVDFPDTLSEPGTNSPTAVDIGNQ